MQKEEERQAKLRKPDEKPPVWQEWPVLSYVSTKLVSNLSVSRICICIINNTLYSFTKTKY